jgi:S-formylglutathione hydrolase FrmB
MLGGPQGRHGGIGHIRAVKGQVELHRVQCPALTGNALGDPVERPCAVYLPPGYATSAERYPVVFFLHAFLGTAAGWLNVSPFSPTVPERLDVLIAQEGLPPCIGIFPDGWTALGGSQWSNSAATGRYRDAVVKDVLGWVDGTLRTVPRRAARAVLGRSSGGYGSWQLVRHHPDVFGHMAAHSGDAYFEYCFLPEFPKAAGALLKAGGVEAWRRAFLRRAAETKMGGDDHAVVNTLAMAAAYSPKAAEPLGLELPFEAETGALRQGVWERWLAEDPVRFVAADTRPFLSLKTLFIDCGTRDEFGLRWGARMLAQTLSAAGASVTHEEYEDGHMGTSYRFDRSLRLLLPRLARS